MHVSVPSDRPTHQHNTATERLLQIEKERVVQTAQWAEIDQSLTDPSSPRVGRARITSPRSPRPTSRRIVEEREKQAKEQETEERIKGEYDGDNAVIQVLQAYYDVLLSEAQPDLTFTLPGPIQRDYVCPVRICV
jgi:hypothetical protein